MFEEGILIMSKHFKKVLSFSPFIKANKQNALLSLVALSVSALFFSQVSPAFANNFVIQAEQTKSAVEAKQAAQEISASHVNEVAQEKSASQVNDYQQPSNVEPTYTLNGTVLTIQGTTSGAAAELPATDFGGRYQHWLVDVTAGTANPITDDQLRAITEVHISGNVVTPKTFFYAFCTSSDYIVGWDSLQKFIVDANSSFTFAPDAACAGMFEAGSQTYPSQLQSISGNITFENVGDAASMFENCHSLTSLPEGFASNSTQKCYSMFYGCSSLKTLPSTFKPADNADMSEMFAFCSALTRTPFSSIKPTECHGMFLGCTSLTDISSLESWDVSGVIWNPNRMDSGFLGFFAGCTSLNDVSPLANWNIDASCKEMVEIPGISGSLSGLTGMFGKLNADTAEFFFDIKNDVPAPPVTRMSFAADSGWKNMDSQAMNSIGVWQPVKELGAGKIDKTYTLAASDNAESLSWISEDTPSKGEYPTTQELFDNFEAWGKEGTWVAVATPGPTPEPTPEPTPSPSREEETGTLPTTGDMTNMLLFASLLMGATIVLTSAYAVRKRKEC